MARVPYLSADQLDDADRDLLSRQIAITQALVNSPGAARAFSGLAGYIRSGSSLDARLRELAILQVGYSTRTAYEWSHHVKLALDDFGCSSDDIRAIAIETGGRHSGLGELDRAVLAAAREMVSDLAVAPDTWETLAASLSTEHLVDLVIAISVYCGVVRILQTLQIDVEPAYERYLEEYPLPGSARQVSGGITS